MRYDDEGLHLHQSDIGSWMNCPESLRRKMIAAMNGESDNTDAAFVGTCLHTVIEYELQQEYPYESLEEAQAIGALAFLNGFEDMVADGTSYRRSTFGTDLKAMDSLKPLVESWYNSPEREYLLSSDKNYTVEYEFDEMFTTHFSGMKLFLAGRMDLIEPSKVTDWKTSGGEWKLWEKQRWDQQSTVYTFVAARNGLITPNKFGDYRFDFKVLQRKSKAVAFETYTVYRTMGNWTWLERVCQNIATTFVTLGLENEWPLNDHSALCGPKWCPFWDNCKGAYVNGVTWK